jgi:hypothetical protein
MLLFSRLDWIFCSKNAEMLTSAYFKEKRGTHDIVFLGPSTVMNAVYPPELWNTFGFTAYNLATGNQSPSMSWYLAREVIKRDHPKLLVLDCGKMKVGEIYDTLSYLHFVTDRMPFLSVERLKLIRFAAAASECEFDETVGLIAPLTLYHNRWTELTYDDMRSQAKAMSFGAKVDGHTTQREFEAFAPYEADPDAALPELSERQLRRIIEYCDSCGTKVLLLTMPNMMRARYVGQMSYEERVDAAAAVQKIADEYGVPYLNLLDEGQNIGLDPLRHTTDGQHLNVKGAGIFTKWLGEWIAANTDVEDRRGDSAYAYMNGRYQTFTEYVARKTGS